MKIVFLVHIWLKITNLELTFFYHAPHIHILGLTNFLDNFLYFLNFIKFISIMITLLKFYTPGIDRSTHKLVGYYQACNSDAVNSDTFSAKLTAVILKIVTCVNSASKKLLHPLHWKHITWTTYESGKCLFSITAH